MNVNDEYLSQSNKDIFQVASEGLQLAEAILEYSAGRSSRHSRLALDFIQKHGDWENTHLHPWYRRYLMIQNYGADVVDHFSQAQYPDAVFYPGELVLYLKTVPVIVKTPISTESNGWRYTVYDDRGEVVTVAAESLSRLRAIKVTALGAQKFNIPQKSVVTYVPWDVDTAYEIYYLDERVYGQVKLYSDWFILDAVEIQ